MKTILYKAIPGLPYRTHDEAMLYPDRFGNMIYHVWTMIVEAPLDY